MVEKAEDFLLNRGFRQVRVRIHGTLARIELLPEDFPKVFVGGLREEILHAFKLYGFLYVSLDLMGYRTGSMNECIGLQITRQKTQNEFSYERRRSEVVAELRQAIEDAVHGDLGKSESRLFGMGHTSYLRDDTRGFARLVIANLDVLVPIPIFIPSPPTTVYVPSHAKLREKFRDSHLMCILMISKNYNSCLMKLYFLATINLIEPKA